MPKCRDCVHVEVCLFYIKHTANLYGAKIDETYLQNARGDKCKDFQDRSRFVELPCKPGEKIFYFLDTAGRIYESTVTQLVYGATGFLIDSDVMFNSDLIGKRFFLTREAAERALKGRDSNAGRNDI